MFSVVKMMKEQGNQFDWSQIAIDIPSLPCFKPEAEWPDLNGDEGVPITDVLAEGYTTVQLPSSASLSDNFTIFVVRQTGDNPTVSTSIGEPIFTDCEPVVLYEDSSELSHITPVRTPMPSITKSGSEIFMLLTLIEEGFVFLMNSEPLMVSVVPQGKVYLGAQNRVAPPIPPIG